MKVYSVGYEGLGIRELLDILKRNNINLLIDVRENPYSKQKEFSKKQLEEYLKNENIDYLHLKELGNPSYIRKKYTDEKQILCLYWNYIKNVLYSKLTYLEELIKNNNVALLCLEKDPFKCHRNVIGWELIVRGTIKNFIDLRVRMDKREMIEFFRNLENSCKKT
jgi:uncharacterized protein (DUF488 family)